MNQLVVLSALVATTLAAPSGLLYPAAPLAYAPGLPAVARVVQPAVYSVPGVTVSETVHYAPTPVVTGYTSSVLKPDLGRLAAPAYTVAKSAVLAPARPVDTVVPQVTHVQPEVAVKQVAYDVPVHTPYLSHVEVKARPGPVVVPVAAPAPAHLVNPLLPALAAHPAALLAAH